jgi:mono/diheme cytochrome c family protein
MTTLANGTSGLKSRRFRTIVAVLLVFGIVGGVFAYYNFFRTEPPPFFQSDEDHFLFGSIGTEDPEGIPYWIWLVLPRIFPEYLPAPGGYAAVGFPGKDGRDMPVGFSKVTVGFERIGINCAACHAATFRARAGDPPTIVAGAASHQTSPQAYLRFLFACANDPRFTADTILGEIAKNYRLSMTQRLLYRFAIIPFTKRGILQLQQTDAWMQTRPDWGRGRIDPFNPVKFRYLGQPIDATIGNSDMQPVWNLAKHPNSTYHWDGLNTNLQEVVLSSAIGDGAPLKWVDRDFARWNNTKPEEMSSLRRIYNFLSTAPPPKYPFAIDASLAATGAAVFQGECASCHALDGQRTGHVIPLAEVGTDRHRLDMWRQPAADAYNAKGEGHAWKFSHFRQSEGYVAVPLDGLWLRAPYLHNGSVPSLTDLLEPVDRRPKSFWRGYDVYDQTRIGFVTDGPEAQAAGTPFDTSLPSNSSAGHLWGTTLDAARKRALLEYLKTL